MIALNYRNQIILNDHNYAPWRARIYLILKAEKLLDCIHYDPCYLRTLTAELCEKNSRARKILQLLIEPALWTEVRHFRFAYDIWRTFQERHQLEVEGSHEEQVDRLLLELANYKMPKLNADVVGCTLELVAIFDKLKALGSPLSEEEKINCVIGALPKHYHQLLDYFRHSKCHQCQTLAELQRLIVLVSQVAQAEVDLSRRQSSSSPSTRAITNASISNSSSIGCFEEAHVKNDKRKNSTTETTIKAPMDYESVSSNDGATCCDTPDYQLPPPPQTPPQPPLHESQPPEGPTFAQESQTSVIVNPFPALHHEAPPSLSPPPAPLPPPPQMPPDLDTWEALEAKMKANMHSTPSPSPSPPPPPPPASSPPPTTTTTTPSNNTTSTPLPTPAPTTVAHTKTASSPTTKHDVYEEFLDGSIFKPKFNKHYKIPLKTKTTPPPQPPPPPSTNNKNETESQQEEEKSDKEEEMIERRNGRDIRRVTFVYSDNYRLTVVKDLSILTNIQRITPFKIIHKNSESLTASVRGVVNSDCGNFSAFYDPNGAHNYFSIGALRAKYNKQHDKHFPDMRIKDMISHDRIVDGNKITIKVILPPPPSSRVRDRQHPYRDRYYPSRHYTPDKMKDINNESYNTDHYDNSNNNSNNESTNTSQDCQQQEESLKEDSFDDIDHRLEFIPDEDEDDEPGLAYDLEDSKEKNKLLSPSFN